MIPFWLSNLFASLELVLVLWMVPSGDITRCQSVRWIPRFTAKSYVRRRRRAKSLHRRNTVGTVELKYGVCGYVWHSSISPVPYFCHGFVDSASHDPHYFQLHFEFDCPAHRNLQITSDALDFWYPVLSFTHFFAGSSAPYWESVCCWVVNGKLLSFWFWAKVGSFGQVFQPAWMCTQRMPWFPCCAMGSPRPWR